MMEATGWRRAFRGRIREAWQSSAPLVDLAVEDEKLDPPPNILERILQSLSSILLVIMAITILVEVFYRFVLNKPQLWSLEAPTFAYIWLLSVAAGLSDWRDDQISFDLLYELYPDRIKRGIRFISNLVIAAMFLTVLPGTWGYLKFANQQPTTGLPFSQGVGIGGIVLYFAIGGVLRLRLVIHALHTATVSVRSHLSRARDTEV